MRIVILFLLVVALAGCATSYKPEGYSGGFSETQLDTSLFKVSFQGNGWTKPERAEDLALLRGAELTLRNGFSYFVVIDSQSRERQGSYTTPKQSYTTANATAYGNSAYGSAQTTTYGGQTIHTSRPTTTLTMMCFKEKPEIQGIVYNAQFLCNSLGQKYDAICGAN
jgi:uncharacterized protein YceK